MKIKWSFCLKRKKKEKKKFKWSFFLLPSFVRDIKVVNHAVRSSPVLTANSCFNFIRLFLSFPIVHVKITSPKFFFDPIRQRVAYRV